MQVRFTLLRPTQPPLPYVPSGARRAGFNDAALIWLLMELLGNPQNSTAGCTLPVPAAKRRQRVYFTASLSLQARLEQKKGWADGITAC